MAILGEALEGPSRKRMACRPTAATCASACANHNHTDGLFSSQAQFSKGRPAGQSHKPKHWPFVRHTENLVSREVR